LHIKKMNVKISLEVGNRVGKTILETTKGLTMSVKPLTI
jgi:hypothetical protein